MAISQHGVCPPEQGQQAGPERGGLPIDAVGGFRLSDAIHALGSPAFSQAFIGMAHRELGVDQAIVFRATPDGALETLLAENIRQPALAPRLAGTYTRRYRGGDPNRPLLAPMPQRQVLLRHLDLAGMPEGDYRRRLFVEPHLVDKMAIIAATPGYSLYVNFYRGAERGNFTADDVRQVRAVQESLVAVIERHVVLTQPPPPCPPDRIAALFAGLSPAAGAALSGREAQICGRIVLGYASEAIALELGVSLHSVTTYRRRAFAKLGIATQAELFAVVLRHRRALDF